MHLRSIFALPFLLFAAGCQSSSSSVRVVEADPAVRKDLLAAMTALEGRWEGQVSGVTQVVTFEVTSAGSVVRERMFPDTPHEMTNMYALDGNALRMTHYCAGGNQPHMRATSLAGGKLEFRSDGVSDLKAADEAYMSDMTLVWIDEDHIEERWRATKNGELDHEMVFELARVR